MSINPPQQIADFFGFLTGMPWPEADEDLMRTVANDYYAVAEDLTILEGYIGQLVPIVLEHFEGDAAESYAAAMRDLIGEVSGPNTMHQTSQLSHDLGDAARNVANQVEYTKLMAIIQVVELLVQVLAAMFFSPFTFGGSFFNVALEFAFTREALKNLFIWLLRTIASQTFMGIAGGLFQDMIIQVYQLSSHHTDKWNTDSTIESLKQGALGGLLAGPLELFGQGAGKLLGKIFGKGAGSILSKKIESSLKAGMNGLENSAEHFAENVGKTVGHAALDGFNGFVGTEIKSLGKKTVGELAGAAAESGARGAAKSAAEGAEQAAERDIAKLAGKLGDEASQQAFAKDVGNLLGAAVPQIEAGFVRFGSGTIAEAFAERMGTVFEKHLADAADPVLRGEANKIGRDFGEAFARNWGRLGADHSGLNDALSRALGGLAEHRGLSALAHGLPELFTPGQITGNAVSKLFQRMFEEHPLHGNTLYQLGHSVGEMLKDGMENNFNEGTYNLIFMEDHQFTTSWNTFVSGAAMGLIGKTLHKLFEPAMTRYQEWLRDRQFRDNPDDSAYFGLLHPLNFVSFIANMSGHSAPFPVPRPTSYDVDASAGESAKDLLRWFFGNPFSGFDFRADAPVVNWFTSSDTPVPGDRPTQDAVAETLGGIRTSGGADPGVTGVTGDGTAPGHDEDTSDGAPATADAAATPPSRPRTETAGGPDGARAPVEPHTPAAGTGGDTADAFDAGLPRLTESRPFRDEFAHRDDFDLVEPSTRPAHAPVSGPRTEAVGPYTPADPATGHVGHQDTATVSDAFDAVPAGHQESPPTEPTTRLTAQAPDRTTLTPGRTRGHDADAHEPTPAVDRVHGLGLLDDQPDAAGSYPRPAPLAEPVDRVTARDGTSVRDDEVRTRPIADPVTGENIGRGVLDDTEWSAVGPSLSGLPRTLHYETGLEWNENTLVRDVPWDAEHTYFYVGHGNDEGFHLETEHGEKRASGEQLGGFLRRRPSVIRLKQAADEGKPASITLIACESAAHAQAVADATGLPVHAPTAGIDFGEDGLFAAATESGAAGEIRTFRPGGPGPVADGKPNEPTMRPVVVPFGPASTTLDLRWAEHLADVARNIAPELVRRHRAGLPAPVIRVTGRGGGPAGAEDGKARADAVANVLTAALRGYLVPRGVDFDTLSLVRTASERASEPPAGDRPDRQADQGPWTATVSLEYPRPGARPSRVPVTGIPAGGWIGEHQLPAPSARRFREALEHLPPRDDAYVLAMHVGENGAPITAEQLADTLIDAYDCGKLDGKATVDFVACGLGALVHDHVPEAMAALWAHHALHGRPGVPAVIQGRAPVGPVWAVPKVVDGSVRPDGERALVVADYVGVRPDGTPVVVSGPDAFWRTFRDSGDGAHTPETSVGGGRLASDGSTDHELPTGYERHDAAKVNEPSAGLTPIEGAVTFGAEGNGGPSQQNRVPSGTGTGPASRNRPPGGTDHPPRGPRGSGSDPATAPDRRDRRASPAEPREQPSERSVRRDRLGVPSTDRSRSASPAPERREAGAGRAFAAQPGRSERSRERSPFSRSQQSPPPGARGGRSETAHSRSARSSAGGSSPRRAAPPAPLSADARTTLQDNAARWLFGQPDRTTLTSRQLDRLAVYTDTAERLGLLLTGPLAEGSLRDVRTLFRATGVEGRTTVSRTALDGLVRTVLGAGDDSRVTSDMLREVFDHSHALADLDLPVNLDTLRGFHALSRLVGSDPTRQRLDDLAHELVGGPRGPRTTADLVEVAAVVHRGGRVTRAGLLAGLNVKPAQREGRSTEGARAGGSRERLRPQDRSGSDGAGSGGSRDRVRREDRPAPEAVRTDSHAAPEPAGKADPRKMLTDYLRGRAARVADWSERRILRFMAHRVFEVPVEGTLPSDAYPRLERLALTAHESGIPFSLENIHALRQLLDAAPRRQGVAGETPEHVDRVVRDVMSLPPGTAVDSGHRTTVVALARYLREELKRPVTLTGTRALRALTDLSPVAGDSDPGHILRDLARRVLPDLPDLPDPADPAAGPAAVTRLLELASTVDRHPLDIDTLRAAARGGLDGTRRDTASRPAPDAMEIGTPDAWRSPSPDDSSVASTPTATGSAQPGTPDSHRSSSDESLASEVHAFDEMTITAPAMPILAEPSHALPAPPPGFHGNDAFWQAIGGDRRTGRRLTENEYLRFVEETGEGGGRPLGFVINTMVSHKDVGQIREVLDAITQGMEGMDNRVAVVVGVNAESGSETQLNEAVSATRRAVADLGLPVAVVPATFKPKGGRFPYGRMRNAVMHDEATRQLIGAMVKNGLHPYLSVQDFDRGSRMTAEGGHIFNRVERQLRIEHGDLPPVRPLAYIGGYRMPDRADLHRLLTETINRYPVGKVPPELVDPELADHHLDRLQEAVRRDMIARQNQARIHPLLPYAPEPNLFVDGAAVLLRDDRGGPRLSWGEGAAEFARLGQDLNQLNGWELRQHHEPHMDGRAGSVPVPDSRTPARENRSMPRGRDEIHAQVAADAANNRLPHRGEAFRTDFVDGATSTDLSRLSQTLIDKNGVLGQTHANLTTVLDRLFQGKSAKDGVELAAVRKIYAPRSRDVYETQQPLRPRTGGATPGQPSELPMASKLGDRPENVLNSAVSAPVGGPFTAEAGIQGEHKLHAALELALSTEELILGRKLAYVRFEPDILGHRELSRLDVFPTRPRPAQGVGRRDQPVRSESGVPADGDCLYHAVNAVRRIDVGPDTALHLRNTVLDWMLTPDNLTQVVRFANERGVDINDLVTTIALSGNWHGPAGDLAATMVASALNARLVIDADGTEHTVTPLRVPGRGRSRPLQPGQVIRLRLSGNHYEPVGRTVLGGDDGGAGRATKRRRSPEDGPGRGTKRSHTSDARRTETSAAGPSRPRSAGRQDAPRGGGASARQHRAEDTEMTDANPTEGVRKFGGADRTPASEEQVTRSGGDPISEMVEALCSAHASGTRLLQGEGSDPGRAAAVARFPRDERFFSVAIHTGGDGTPVWNGQDVTPAEFAVVLAELHERGVWDGETPLQFPACRFGDGHEYSFAAETMLLLHEQLPHLPLEAYAPDGDLWHVPSVLPDGGLDHVGPGHLVVGDGVVIDSSGRPRVVPGGGWLRMTVDPHDGELFVDELGAHLVVDGEQRPNTQPVPPGYTLSEGGSHDALDQAVSFGRGTASPGEQHGRPVPYDPGDGPPSPAGANVAHWVGDGHPDAAVQARTSRALARVPDADRYFTVAMHIGAQHRPVRDGAVMSAQAFAEHVLALRDGGAWDGERPLRLVACDLAADPSFVADVMRVLWDRGVRADAYAADGPVWFTPLGGGTSELVASRAVGFKATPDGVKPALLPGTGWVRFSPPAHAGGQAVTEPVGPLLRPRTESPFVDAGPDEHLTPAAGAVSFGADHPARRDRPDLPTDQGPAPVHAPPLPQTGTRTVPSRRDARPSVLIDNYRVVTAHGDGPPPGGSLAERSRRAAFSRRDAYRNGGRVVQTGTGHDAQTFPVHRAVRSLITEDHPQVRLSHDASLAIAQVAGRPKEFYALPEVVERGNVRLRQNGSEARLVLNDEVSIEFEHDQRTVRLFKVSVEFDGDPSGICRDFSHDVLGGTHTHAVLHDVRPPEEGGTGSTAIAFVNTASDAEVGGTHHLVAGLMDSAGRNDETEAGPQWAKTLTEKARTQPERDWPTPGEKYGRALNRSHPAGAGLRRELTRKVRSTGINEEAWAQPGEAYLMQAVSHKTSGWERLFTHDFSRTVEGASEERPTTWGYHFAPVVVESLDGTHQITLENARFNRRSRALLDETLTATIEHYRPRIDEIRSELGQQVERGELSPGDPRLELARLIVQIRETEHELAKPATASDHPGAARHEDPSHRTALLESALKQARTEARRALLTISGEDMGLDGDMWWFSMHGRAKGENFFETRAMLDDTTARGTMTNPVVLVLASGLDNARLDLEPDPSTQRLSAHDVARLESLAGRIAKGALWRIRQGMSLPEIRITSHALPGERSQGTVQRDQVSTRLREILDARLEAIQRDDASISQPVRAHHFRVVEDLEIRDPDRVRALMGGSDGDGELPVHPQVRVEVHLDEHPADRVDHTPEQLADLARQTGLRRGGPRLGSLGGQQTPMDDTLLARMRDIIGVGRRLDGQEGEPGLTVLTGVRRLSDVLAREYGHTGELRVGHLDPLVRDVLGLGFSAEVTTADRLRLLDIARSAKVRGRPLTVESLTRTARLGSAGGAPDTGIHAEEVQAGPSRPATEPTGPSRRPIEDGEAGRGDPATVGSGEPVPPGDRAEPAEAGEPTRTGSPAQPGSDRPGTHLHGADSPSPDLPVSDPPGQGPSVRLPMLDWSTSVGLADPPSEPAAADRPVRASDAGGTGNGAVRSAHPQYGTAGEEAPVSRIGKLRVPAGVDVTLDGRTVAVKGPKGSLTHTVAAPIEIAKDEDGMLLVTRPDDERVSKALHGLSRALVANMITGVTAGYSKQLEISGVGYRVQAKGADLEFALGYSHPILVQPPEGVSFTVESPTRFSVEGIDKQKVGEVAAYIRDLRMPEPYKAKGVGYAGEVIREIESRADDGPPTMTPVREPFAGGSRRHSAGAGGQPLPGPVGPATEGEQQAGHAVPHQPSLGTVPEPPGEPEPEPAAAEPSRPRPRSVADVIADVLSPAGPGPHPPAPRGPSRTG